MGSGSSALAGVVNVTTGSATTAGAAVATISASFQVAPRGCVLFPANAATALAMTMIYVSTPTNTGFAISDGGTALAVSTAYSWSYSCF